MGTRAQQLPLPELYAVAAACQNDLAAEPERLQRHLHQPRRRPRAATEVIRALGQVTRRATAMAIFTLGIAQRAHLTAHQN